ncbi:hypothetical protein [Thermosporothrix hazakensis]|jgi:hypothetical protein|uniref:hypothetical protein n=1 Tax=Thermosporothrix hazakensis TaxID=644383 RepID=UPI000DAC3187|nr:hypothetical protein [Thermosporothrix hazakensis]GCE45528.1 hypothetical protein KTH_03970 [Thermosporothrix hazakensis]
MNRNFPPEKAGIQAEKEDGEWYEMLALFYAYRCFVPVEIATLVGTGEKVLCLLLGVTPISGR